MSSAGIIKKVMPAFFGLALLTSVFAPAFIPQKAQADCPATPDPTKGTDTQSVNLSVSGTYYVWTRLLAPDTVNNSVYMQVDGGCGIDLGDSADIPPNTWTWVNYQNGVEGTPVTVNLTAGTHQVLLTGAEGGVGVDRVLLLADPTCVPTDTGDNCTPIILPSPTVQNLAWNSKTSTLSWSAFSGATSYQVEQIHNPGGSQTPVNYSYPNIKTTSCQPGGSCNFAIPAPAETVNYSVMPLGSDGNPVPGSSWATPISVTWPADKTAPTIPGSFKATAQSSSQINLSWKASTDTGGSGLAGYSIYRVTGGKVTLVSTVTGTTYSDSGLSAKTTYQYYVVAVDGANNMSSAAGPASATTPAAPKTSRH